MHPLYKEPHFRIYLRFSIEIFGKQYPFGQDYKTHPNWEAFKELLHKVKVKKILICSGMIIGSISQQFSCFPITESSVSEDKVRSKNVVVEEIFI
jgi:hypothetical protein